MAQSIPVGTQVPVRITSRLTSNGGGSTTAIVDADIYANDSIVISRGTLVETSVRRIESGFAGKPGRVFLEVTGTTSVNGKHVVLTGDTKARGHSKRGVSLGVSIGLGLFVWPCWFCLLIQGGEAEIAPGTVLQNVVVSYPVQ